MGSCGNLHPEVWAWQGDFVLHGSQLGDALSMRGSVGTSGDARLDWLGTVKARLLEGPGDVRGPIKAP